MHRFGFIRFEDKESANRAVDAANQSFWHGRRINVRHREPPQERGPRELKEPTRSIYIGNIPYETSDTDLNAIFKKLDNVQDVRVAIDRATGWPRGFAHVDFTDVESCTAALNSLQGQSLSGRPLRFDYAAASKSGKTTGKTDMGDNSFKNSM